VRRLLTYAFLAVIGFVLVLTVAEMPTYGDSSNPVHNEVAARYLEQGTTETGAPNTISAIITDYRAFDTLGEATVLFTAIAAVVACLKSR